MKNIFYICFSLIISSILSLNLAKASSLNPYVGLGVSTTHIESSDIDEEFLPELNAGIKFNINNKFFIAPEVYYNVVNEIFEDSGIDGTINYSDEFKNLYGFKLNFGYNINEKLNTTFLVGTSYYESDYTETGYRFNAEEWGYLFGLGLGYKINENIEAKLNYEYQKLDKDTLYAKMHQIKIGLAYNF